MESAEIKIIHENDRYLVIDKPVGLVVNRSITAKGMTLQDMIAERGGSELNFEEESDDENSDFGQRSGIAHRLDKDTSGILLVAKKRDFFDYILSQFKERRVQKEYVAVVHGSPEEDTLEIDAPIKRNPKDPMKMAIVADGKESHTKIMKLNEKEIDGEKYTLLKVEPSTGRTHQIRVHLAAILLYIAGDPIYCPKKLLTLDEKIFGRMMLHAHKLRFFDTELQEFVQFESSFPQEFLPFA